MSNSANNIGRHILLEGVVHSFDISDGLGDLSFGMNGAGGMRVMIDGRKDTDNGYVENKRMLDGSVGFIRERGTRNFNFFSEYRVRDDRYDTLKDIRKLGWEQIKELPIELRIKTVLFGLKYDELMGFNRGYRFGQEVVFENISVCFDAYKLVVFHSHHNGYMAFDYLELTKDDEAFSVVFEALKDRINDHFSFSKSA